MGDFNVRYLVIKPQKGHNLYYWEPSKKLQSTGWRTVRLARDTNKQEDAIREAMELNHRLDDSRAQKEKSFYYAKGTIGWLISEYKKDDLYIRLSDKTKKGYDYYLGKIEEWAGRYPIQAVSKKVARAFYKGIVKRFQDKSEDGTYEAFHTIKVARRLFEYAKFEELIINNPFQKLGVTTPKERQQVWEQKEVDAFYNAAIEGKRPSLALAVLLAAYTGQRLTDVRKMAWGQYNGPHIDVRQQKTKAFVSVQCLPELKIALDKEAEHKKNICILVSETTKKPYTEDHLSKSVAKIRDAAAIRSDLQFKDLRRTAVVNLARAGATVPEIASITGHSIQTCQKILDTYFPKDKIAGDNAIKKLADYRGKN